MYTATIDKAGHSPDRPWLVSGVWHSEPQHILLERLQLEFGVTGTSLAWLQSYLEGRNQFVKLGLHQSPVVKLEVGVPQWSVLGPLLFAVYCSQVGDIITDHSLPTTTTNTPMTSSSTSPWVSTTQLLDCLFLPRIPPTSDKWYLQNVVQLNSDKSEALVISTANQLCVVDSSASSVSVAGVYLPVAEDMKVLGVVLVRCLTFHKHVSMVAQSCNYHAQAIPHIRHLLTTELAQTLAWFCPGSTTATLCFTAHRPALSRNCSEFRPMQLVQ